MTRTFTVQSSDIQASGGRYKSETPGAAAKKAATQLFKKSKASKNISFALRETTSGSEKKVYLYNATREKLAKPVERIIKGVKIVNEYKINIHSQVTVQ